MTEPLSPEFVLRLQRQIGNRAVTHFLRRRTVDARPTQLVLATPTALQETKADLAVAEPTEPAGHAAPENKIVDAVTVTAETRPRLSAWRRMMNWIGP